MADAPAPSIDRHINAAKRRLTHLAGLASRTEQDERRIKAAAQRRLRDAQADREKLRPRALADHEAGTRFMELSDEIGQLQMVIARSEQALNP